MVFFSETHLSADGAAAYSGQNYERNSTKSNIAILEIKAHLQAGRNQITRLHVPKGLIVLFNSINLLVTESSGSSEVSGTLITGQR